MEKIVKIFKKNYLLKFIIVGAAIAVLNFISVNLLINFFNINLAVSLAYWLGVFCHYLVHFCLLKKVHQRKHKSTIFKYLIFLILQNFIVVFIGHWLIEYSINIGFTFIIQPALLFIFNYLAITRFVFKPIKKKDHNE